MVQSWVESALCEIEVAGYITSGFAAGDVLPIVRCSW